MAYKRRDGTITISGGTGSTDLAIAATFGRLVSIILHETQGSDNSVDVVVKDVLGRTLYSKTALDATTEVQRFAEPDMGYEAAGMGPFVVTINNATDTNVFAVSLYVEV